MILKKIEQRTVSDNLWLSGLTAFSAGVVNVISVIVFFAFASNVTGHYAILAQEISKGNWYEAAVVATWILAFLMGNFISNIILIHARPSLGAYKNILPIFLEIICLLCVGIYGDMFYAETLAETEVLVGILLFSMGLQNGLTAGLTKGAIKTTHLTGLTTDLGILFAKFTKREFRQSKKDVRRAQMLLLTASTYLTGGVVAGVLYANIMFKAFYLACLILFGVAVSGLVINRTWPVSSLFSKAS